MCCWMGVLVVSAGLSELRERQLDNLNKMSVFISSDMKSTENTVDRNDHDRSED